MSAAGVVDQNAHLETERALAGAGADAAEADDQHGLVEEIDRQRGQLIAPGPRPHAGVVLGGALGEREHQRERLLGDRGRVGDPDGHEGDALVGERRDIDGVEADADARRHLDPRRGHKLRRAERRERERDALDVCRSRWNSCVGINGL